jgi:hypothetical protein
MGVLLTLMRRTNPLTSPCIPRRRHVNPSRMSPHKKASQARCEQIQETCWPTSLMRQLKCHRSSRVRRSPS